MKDSARERELKRNRSKSTKMHEIEMWNIHLYENSKQQQQQQSTASIDDDDDDSDDEIFFLIIEDIRLWLCNRSAWCIFSVHIWSDGRVSERAKPTEYKSHRIFSFRSWQANFFFGASFVWMKFRKHRKFQNNELIYKNDCYVKSHVNWILDW